MLVQRSPAKKVIKQLAVECPGAGREPSRRPQVGVAVLGLAAWVIVRQQDRGAAVLSCVDHDFAEREIDAA